MTREENIEQLRDLTDEGLDLFISFKLNRLSQDEKKHLRFNMSGCGNARKHNQDILAIFEDYGIYDSTHYLYLDTHKGAVHLYYHMWDKEFDEPRTGIMDLTTWGTRAIIKTILETFVINHPSRFRRRD